MRHNSYRLSYYIERRRLGLALFLVIVLLFLRGFTYSSYALSNVGSVLLNQVTASEGLTNEAIAVAERLLQRATVLDFDNVSAWRFLGHVRIIQGKEDAAIVAWQNAGDRILEEFIWRGGRARQEDRFEEAIQWYERGHRVRRSWGDWRYYTGLTYAEMGQWEDAFVTLQESLSLPLVTIGESDVYYQLGLIYSKHPVPVNFSSVLVNFDKAITQNDFATQASAISAHYERAEVLRQLGRVEDALDGYELIVSQEPEHYWAHVHAGTLYWEHRKDTERAEVALKAAISLQPNIKWAYRMLGQIYQEMGRETEALEMYQQVLAVDSQDRFAREQVNKLRVDQD